MNFLAHISPCEMRWFLFNELLPEREKQRTSLGGDAVGIVLFENRTIFVGLNNYLVKNVSKAIK